MSHFNARNTPFSPGNTSAYKKWREWKLNRVAEGIEELIVEVNDPRQLSGPEYTALHRCIRRNNMVIYAGNSGTDPDKSIPRTVAERFGLRQLNHNWLADDDGLTSLTVNDDGEHPQYIPYTNRPINWHTDGYYNPNEAQVHGLMLHCVHRAARGGENALMDHEIAYILMRDENPDYIEALMQPDVMTIPPGTDMHGNLREAAIGPVFSINSQSGDLHMRYTARRRNIKWKEDKGTCEARTFLEKLLNSGDSPYIYRGTLEPGMGLISNNVLHDRGGFSDMQGHPQRLLYRARYFDRIADTGISDIDEAELAANSAHKKGGPETGAASISKHR
jgi:hypothetical protein